MQYTLLQLSTAFEEPFMSDVLVAELADLGFESFETDQELIKAYIQTSMLDKAKVEQEQRPLANISDSFRKVVVSGDYMRGFYNDDGIYRIGVYEFLLNVNCLDE